MYIDNQIIRKQMAGKGKYEQVAFLTVNQRVSGSSPEGGAEASEVFRGFFI